MNQQQDEQPQAAQPQAEQPQAEQSQAEHLRADEVSVKSVPAERAVPSGRAVSLELFGDLTPLARVVVQATEVVEEETRMVVERSSLDALRLKAEQKEALLAQHDLQLSRLKGKGEDGHGELSAFVTTLDRGVRKRLRTLYVRFEEALRRNGLRLKAALTSSEMLLEALSDAAQGENDKGPQLYTSQGRLSEGGSTSLSHSLASGREV